MDNQELKRNAIKLRRDILRSTHAAASGHPGGSLSATELFTLLYFEELQVDPKNPDDPKRDRFVLSKGHCAPGLYAALAARGFFPEEDLLTLRHIGSYLQGHPDMKLGDGEIEEGEVWEAAMLAGFRKLDNLVVIVDNNNLQIDGPIDEVNSPYPIDKKFAAFNFHVINVEDGNDFDQLRAAFAEARNTKGCPTAIVMKTVKGKGISFMENQVGWHGKGPNDEELEKALAELDKAEEML